jgi:hypothetical protein
MILQTGRVFGLAAALLAVSMLGGCASGVTRPDGQKTGVFKPSAEFPIAKVTVATTDEARAKLKNNFKFSQDQMRSTIEQALVSNQMFSAQHGQNGFNMDVLVTRIRVRSTFNAVMWGAMAGNDAVEGEVTVKDSVGKTLDKFSVKASYALGGFAGGQDSMRTGWLYEAFAKEVIGQYKPETAGNSKNSAKK